MKKSNTAVVVSAVFAVIAIIALTACIILVVNHPGDSTSATQATEATQQQTSTTETTQEQKQEVNNYYHYENNYYEQKESESEKEFVPSDSSIALTSTLQYDVNIYLSNFSEVGMKSFSGKPSKEDLAYFGLMYNFINRYEKTVEYGDYSDIVSWANHRVKESYAIESIKKFLGITVQPGFAQGINYYRDGYFYTEFTGAPMTEGITVVSKLTDEGNGVYKASFSLYDVGGADRNYYAYNISQIENDNGGCITKVGDGTAYFTAGKLSDRKTYRLTDYSVTRH